MKRIIAVILSAVALCLFFAVPVQGAYVFDSAPLVYSKQSELSANDAVSVFEYSAGDALIYEQGRAAALETLLKTYTSEQIALSPQAILLYPVKVLCEASADGVTWVGVKTAECSAEKITVSLTDDILPALFKSGRLPSAYLDGFTYYLRISTALCLDSETMIAASPAIDVLTAQCPKLVHIEYILIDGADNSANKEFYFAPLENDIILSPASHNGISFFCWLDGNGNPIGSISKETVHTVVQSDWEDKNFNITYVLTTREGYSFLKMDNSANPREFAFSQGATIFDISPPYGWVFLGWYYDEGFSGSKVNSIAAGTANDIILYARWMTENEYIDYRIAEAHWGDLDDDGKITSADARLALRSSVGLEDFSKDIIARADFSKNNRLTSAAARLLLRISVGVTDIKTVLDEYGLLESVTAES